ncbi:MAG: hypothetical protein FWG68_05450 [Defluviitaleaceae bacterium]|nr:hypothetical protein [Defluviitaleaceae bacterium]
MSSKRIAAKEWKRKRKQQQLAFRAGLAGVILLIAGIVGFISWDLWSRTYVMTFAGERISTEELRFFNLLTWFTQDPDALGWDITTASLEQLTQSLIIHREAANHNLEITEEEFNLAAETALNVAFMIENTDGVSMPNISMDRVIEIMTTDFFADQLRDIYTADFVINEEEFAVTFSEFFEANRGMFVEMDFKMYQFTDIDTAMDVWQAFHDAEPEFFDTIYQGQILAGMVDGIADVEIPVFSILDLRPVPELEPYIAELEAFEVGDFSMPIQIEFGTYLIFALDFFYEYSDEEIEEMFREEYTLSNRNILFSEQIEVWRETLNIQLNQRGINAA